ncbi:MAG: sensor domain-containing diguanylate cyclase [Nitrospirales bacterium]
MMVGLEKTVSDIYHVFGFDRIKSRVLAFAFLAILIPALTMGWQSYRLNKQSISEKISEELKSATSHTVREFNLWLKERFYELRVFSSSYEISENVEKIIRAGNSKSAIQLPTRRLTDYLKSVSGKFLDYEDLLVVNASGQVLARSRDQAGDLPLPENWLKQARMGDQVLGDTYWDKHLNTGVQIAAVPIWSPNGRLLGVLAAKMNFHSVQDLLERFAFGETGQVYLVRWDGTIVISSRSDNDFMKTRLPEAAVTALVEQAQAPQDSPERDLPTEYRDATGTNLMGLLRPVAQLAWGVVADITQDEAFAKSQRIVNLTFMMVLVLLIIMGMAAYFLELTIVRPLDRLRESAAKVADGALDINVPVVGHGEVAYLTRVFNDMVERIRVGRDQLEAANQSLAEKNKELQTLSVTDSLTGLPNRKHLMEILSGETERARRFHHFFAVLMIDIDHFKEYNDTFGHLAGDRLLAQIAQAFRSTLRQIDFAARYGGEEFLIMLPETELDQAMHAAERLRKRVASEKFGGKGTERTIQVSIGVAVYPDHGETSEALISRADAALYEAKRRGRNRVVLAGSRPKQATAT